MIWLPRTTDISTYFAQSLEIRGIESRLYLASYCTNHFRHLLWKVSAVCALLTLLGNLFHIRHPEYLILCLKHSFFGSGGTKHPAAVDLK